MDARRVDPSGLRAAQGSFRDVFSEKFSTPRRSGSCEINFNAHAPKGGTIMKASTLSQRPMDVFRTFFLRFVVTIIALGAITISGISNADAITRVGPIDPVHGFPMWYEDQNGLRLDYCDDPACFFLV
ncbi:MAG: hypothetical protein ACE5ER_04570, partial [Nitrospinaceae bacterium]